MISPTGEENGSMGDANSNALIDSVAQLAKIESGDMSPHSKLS
jgi:hypothetical protein